MMIKDMEKKEKKPVGGLAKKASEASTGKGMLSSLASKASKPTTVSQFQKSKLTSKAEDIKKKPKKISETTDLKGKHHNISMA